MNSPITVDQVISWGPCGLHDDNDGENYTPERLCHLMPRGSL